MNKAEKTLKDRLEQEGYTVYRNGWPDFIAQRKGKTIAIEVKAKQSENLEDGQVAIMELLTSLGILSLKWSPNGGFEGFTGKYIEPSNRSPKALKAPKKGSRQFCELVTKLKGGDPFIRKIVVNGRPYWQRCQHIYVDGKRKLKIIKHLGTRKPREKAHGIHTGRS